MADNDKRLILPLYTLWPLTHILGTHAYLGIRNSTERDAWRVKRARLSEKGTSQTMIIPNILSLLYCSAHSYNILFYSNKRILFVMDKIIHGFNTTRVS